MLLLKNQYAACYWLLRKNFLEYLEDSMSQDSLIGSTISTRSQKNISCANKISSPSVLSQDTKTPKVSEGSNKHDNYPKNFYHALLPKQNFERFSNNYKKDCEENQGYLVEHTHQEPDHASTFMKMIKERANAIATANDETHQDLPS
jgi:hypothetical protein